MALMWFLRASQRVTSQTTIFGVGWDVPNSQTSLNHSERGQQLGREDTWQEVTEQGPSCWLAALLRGQGTSWGQAKEQGPTNHQAKGTKGQH